MPALRFLFHDAAPPEIYTLSLHDALPIYAILILDTHPALENAHHVPAWVKYAPLVVGIIGITTAYILYVRRPDLPAKIAKAIPLIYAISFNKWYFDELYDKIFVRPCFYLGRQLWKVGDGTLIDGIGPDGISAAVRNIAKRTAALQTGYLYHYAFSMLIGVVVLVSWYLFSNVG